MISSKTITAICLGATLCTAQAINIRGVVNNAADVGISGAAVKLENANISTTTGSDGSFTLTNGSALIPQDINSRTNTARPVRLQNGTITINISETAPVGISIFDVGGRQIFRHKKTYSPGTYALKAPLQPAGIHLYRVTIGSEAYAFKSSPFGAFSTDHTASARGAFIVAGQAKAAAAIADVISVVNEGQLNYRDSITTSDTSGIVITMIPNAGDVTDADGNVYQSVRIGDQVWTVENLKTTKYNDGTAIPHITDASQWNNRSSAAYCFYENKAANKDKYGALYNWHAVNTGKLAPEGWSVPGVAEWTTLQDYLIANGYNWDETTSKNKIAKSLAAKTDWTCSTIAGTVGNGLNTNNATGFSALPGGFRFYDGNFDRQGIDASWWCATQADGSSGYYQSLYYEFGDLYGSDYGKSYGYSVRLLRD